MIAHEFRPVNMAGVTSPLFLLLEFWVCRFCCLLLLLLSEFTLYWSSVVTWELDIWKNLRLDLMVDWSREKAIICLWQERREALRQGLLFQTTQAVKYDTLDCMGTSCGLWIQGKFFCFFIQGRFILAFFFFFIIHTFSEDAILPRSQNWIPALLPVQIWFCQGHNQSSRFLKLTDGFGAYNSLSWFFPELWPLMT